MEVLTFKVKGNVLSRTNMTRLISCTRNNIFAKFTFDDEWDNVTPKAVQFYKSDECCYSVEIDEDTCTCAIPWEILEQSGCVHITVMGGDLLVTNSVGIAILDSGLIGGLATVGASPSLYSDLQTRVDLLEQEDTKIDEQLVSLDERVTALEDNGTTLSERVTALEESDTALSERITAIEDLELTYATTEEIAEVLEGVFDDGEDN